MATGCVPNFERSDSLMPVSDLLRDPVFRQKAVAFVLALVHNTTFEPAERELALLRQFEAGDISLDEMQAQLESATARHDTVQLLDDGAQLTVPAAERSARAPD